MIFKKIRSLIYSPLILIIGEEEVFDVDTSDPKIDIYDYYEVIGIRATYYDSEEYVQVSLKQTSIKTTDKDDSYLDHNKLNTIIQSICQEE